MRIAIVSTPFIRVPPAGYGGTELFCYDLAEALTDRGHDVTLFTTGDSSAPCEKRWLYARPEWPPSPYDDLSHTAWSVGEIAKEDFDVVHFNSPAGLPFARYCEAAVVYTFHHARIPAISRLYAEHQRATFVAISRRQLELETALDDAVVIHHGLRPERYPPSDRDAGYLLHLGRYAPEKGTHLAIDVAKIARLPITLAGRVHPEDARYFAEEVAPRLVGPNVKDVGEVGPARKASLLRGARAVVCPLQWEEPFGLVAVEAMLCGTPVLGFPRGSFPEIVDEGVTGFLAPVDDVDALGRLGAGLGGFDRAACARRARERFTTAVMASRYEALYAARADTARAVATRRLRVVPATASGPSRRSSAGR